MTLSSVGALRSATRSTTNQFRYSMIHKDPESDILPYCIENDIGSITYMSLEQGLRLERLILKENLMITIGEIVRGNGSLV